MSLEVDTNVLGYVVVEQHVESGTLSTNNLNFKYKNHVISFGEFGFGYEVLSDVEKYGCAQVFKDGVMYTVMKMLSD